MKKLVSVFMITLIMFFPVAFAQATLNVEKYSGADGVNGYIKSQDQLEIVANAKIAGETIDKTQVRLALEDGGETFFQECTEIGNGYSECSFTEAITWFGPLNLKVKLYDNYDNKAAEQALKFIVDSTAPEIKKFELNTNYSRGNVAIQYKAEDYGIEYGTPLDCAGIKTIIISADGMPIITEHGGKGECIKEKITNYEFKPTGTHTYTVCIQATDMLGMESNILCEDVKIDNNAPNIEEFKIYDEEGYTVSHIRSGEVKIVHAKAKITDEAEINSADVSASFLGKTNIKPNTASENYYRWDNIQITNVQDSIATVKAKDVLGNSAQKTFPIQIKVDDTAPTIESITAQKTTADGLPLVGYDTYLTATLQDKDDSGGTGIGFEAKKVFMDLRSLGLGENVQADSCTHTTGSTWECKFKIKPTVDSGTYTITLTDVRDDLNNRGPEQSISIVYDNSPPQQPTLEDYEVISAENRQTAAKGDTVRFVVRSKDFERAEANFTDIGGLADIQGFCVDAGTDEQDCTFESPVEASGPYTATLSFNFYDEADNKATLEHSISVYQLADDMNPNYWEYDYECGPSTTDPKIPVVDRKIAEQIQQLISCKLTLYPSGARTANIDTASISGPIGVEGCVADNPIFFEDVFLTNGGAHSKHPILMLRMDRVTYDLNETTITCPIYITTSINNTVITSTPEIENVNITIKFKNEVLGEMYTNLEKRIDSQLDSIEDYREWIGTAEKFFQGARDLCNIKQAIVNALGAVQTFLSIFAGTSDALSWIPGIGPSIKAQFTGSCKGGESGQKVGEDVIADFLQAFCGIANCQAVTGSYVGGTEVLGGGLEYCQNIEKFFQEKMGFQAIKDADVPLETGNMLNIKDSIVWSTACLCLPGIIHNLNKMLENECQYTHCLMQGYAQYGLPLSFCAEQYQYNNCAYIMGEVFNAIPSSQFWNAISDMLADWIANPFTAVGTAIGMYCVAACPAVPSSIHTVCAIPRTMTLISETITSIAGIAESGLKFGQPVQTYWCDELDKAQEKWEEGS